MKAEDMRDMYAILKQRYDRLRHNAVSSIQGTSFRLDCAYSAAEIARVMYLCFYDCNEDEYDEWRNKAQDMCLIAAYLKIKMEEENEN